MRFPDEQLDVIGLMAAHEAAVADLYRAYARSFPAHRELLQSLAADEVEHARQIARFAEKVRAMDWLASARDDSARSPF
jgi:hypothetical protein